MKIFINAEKDKLPIFSKATGVEFLPLNGDLDGQSGAVAVVVRGNSFLESLEKVSGVDLPLLVVAGTEDQEGRECVEAARSFGVPEACVLVKRTDKVCSLDGREIAQAVKQGRGIGARAIVSAAEYALKNDLRPEPVVWEEPPDVPVLEDPLVDEDKSETPSKNRKKVSFIGSFEDALETAERVVAVFRSTPQAKSGSVAREIALASNGTHVELAGSPASYRLYGRDLEEALGKGYAYSDGKRFEGGHNGCIVVEIDPGVPHAEAMEKVYKKAEKVIHVVASEAADEAKNAVNAWIKSGWKLDGIVPDRPSAFAVFQKAFGKLVYPDVKAFAF